MKLQPNPRNILHSQCFFRQLPELKRKRKRKNVVSSSHFLQHFLAFFSSIFRFNASLQITIIDIINLIYSVFFCCILITWLKVLLFFFQTFFSSKSSGHYNQRRSGLIPWNWWSRIKIYLCQIKWTAHKKCVYNLCQFVCTFHETTIWKVCLELLSLSICWWRQVCAINSTQDKKINRLLFFVV